MTDRDAYLSLLDTVPELVSYSDAEGRYVFINAPYEEWFQIKASAIIGRHYRDVVGDRASAGIADYIETVLSGEPIHFTICFQFPGAGWRSIAVDYLPSVDADGKVQGFFSLMADRTEQEAASLRLAHYQTLLRSLAANSALAEERERQRIGAELHDRAIQTLGISRIEIGQLCAWLPEGSREGLLAKTLRAHLNEAIADIRSILTDLSPPVLQELGLGPAIESLVENRPAGAPKIDLTLSEDLPALDRDGEILVFQILRELIRNADKHAGADRIAVRAEPEAGGLVLDVEDDGCGFDPNRADAEPGNSGHGYGLFSIRERLAMIDGHLEIDSAPGQGTRVEARIPLDQYRGS